MIKRVGQFLEGLFVRSWWVLLFFLLCLMLYEQGLKKRDEDFEKLRQNLVALGMEKRKALELQQDLQIQINSQSDPAWVELILMKELGLVPEDQIKILFRE